MIGDIVVQALELLVFIGFFIFSGVCVYLIGERNEQQAKKLKKVFVISLVIGLVVSMLIGTFPPFVSWAFFSDPAPESTTQYTVVVADEGGSEYDYPREAAPPGRVNDRGERMAKGTGNSPPNKMSVFLLDQANLHRQSLTDGLSIREWIQYRSLPGLLGRDQWTPSEARQMGQLETIRVYQTTINTSSDGLQIDREQTELVYEYNMNGDL